MIQYQKVAQARDLVRLFIYCYKITKIVWVF